MDLDRFIAAQQGVYAAALAELRRGRKQGHWMWFIFPQIAGLGSSAMAQRYGIAGRAEAIAYLAHPVLAARLADCTDAMLAHAIDGAEAILGPVDAMKFRSSMTLFDAVATDEVRFRRALQGFFGGAADAATLRLLG